MIEIKKYKENGYGFILKTAGGHILLRSVEFSSKNEIKKTVENLNAIKEIQGLFERKTNHEGKFLFNLKNREGKLIGQSEPYSSEAGMENGIRNVQNRIASLSDHREL